jgi:hypothetical protein
MVIAITINERGLRSAVQSLNRIRNIPNVVPKAQLEWGQVLERDMKNSARDAGLSNFSGTLISGRGIRYEQAQNGRIGRLFIRLYGIWQDSMKPHFVTLKRSRKVLLSWAQQSRSQAIRLMAEDIASGRRRQGAIYVKPHPWIKAGYRRARPKLRTILIRHVRDALKRR